MMDGFELSVNAAGCFILKQVINVDIFIVINVTQTKTVEKLHGVKVCIDKEFKGGLSEPILCTIFVPLKGINQFYGSELPKYRKCVFFP